MEGRSLRSSLLRSLTSDLRPLASDFWLLISDLPLKTRSYCNLLTSSRWRSAFKLSRYSIEYLIHAYSCRGALVVAAFIEKFLKEWRDCFLLHAIVINLPGTRAGEERDAGSSGTKSKMHRQTVAANQASVISDISQVLEQ